MIDPKSILIATPAASGEVVTGYAGGLAATFANGYAGNVTFLDGCSDVGSARCQIAHAFMRSTFEWLVFVDADIQFSHRDFGMLMQVEPDGQFDGVQIAYSRLGGVKGALQAVDAGIAQFAWNPEVLVCAEYSRKTEAREPVRFGLGFCRIHRSVFERLNGLTHEDGAEIVEQFFHQGELVREYFPMTTLGDGRRVGEDGGFWTLCRIAGFTPRIEQRTRLVHWGRAAYPYLTPVIGSAQ